MKIRGRAKQQTEGRQRFFRVRLVELGLFLFAALLLFRAFELQVLDSRGLVARASSQHQRVIKVWEKRGSIYDWQGRELAKSLEEVSVAVDPQKFRAPKEIARLAQLLGLPEEKISSRIRNGGGFAWIRRGIDPNLGAEIDRAELPGVMLIPEWRRFYPQGELAGQVLGFVGLDQTGLEGLELKYEPFLQGQPDFFWMERDGAGRGIKSRFKPIRDQQNEAPREGADLYLTLDLSLQYLLERALHRGLIENRAKSGVAIALGSGSGRIRALAVAIAPRSGWGAAPASFDAPGEDGLSFNPNAFSVSSPLQWRNRLITDAYEPGSTLKVFVVSAALEERLVRPESRFYCEQGSFAVGPNVIHDHKKYGTLTVGEIIKYSSNIGAAKIGQQLGRKTLHQYFRNFGFGQATGVDLPGEAPAELRSANRWRPVDLASASFGQGVAVTPIQLASAFAAAINGGKLYRPYIVERVVNSRGKVLLRNRPTVVRTVISPGTSRMINKMLKDVVEAGTGQKAQVPGIALAGKTGTSQKFDFSLRQYSSDKLISSFLGVIPKTALNGISGSAEEDLVVLVVIDEPHGPGWGGDVAAPVFGEVVKTGGAVLHLAGRGT
ncbi:MAG: penicillin-binding protein 2 [Proteobacteria bacterium]|nr:penicillin-binding protein 2 [Pseudomonadota bacterium]